MEPAAISNINPLNSQVRDLPPMESPCGIEESKESLDKFNEKLEQEFVTITEDGEKLDVMTNLNPSKSEAWKMRPAPESVTVST